MFPNKKNPLSDWSLSPHKNLANPNPRIADKGKVVVPDNEIDCRIGREAADWKRFRDAGLLLDESSIEKQDREALVHTIKKLQQELYDYQHNMELLLIDKTKLTTTCEELRRAEERLKREHTSHLMALSRVEKVLENENQYVANGGIKKLYEKHDAILDLRKHEFELEMDQKRKVIDEELRNRVSVVEQKELEVLQKEKTVVQREQALEKKLDNFEEKQKDLELKLKALREKEKSLEAEDKTVKMEKKLLEVKKEKLQQFNDKLDDKQLQICKEVKNLKVTEEEKREIQCLQSELRREKDKCVFQKELLLKELETLKQDKDNCQREWQVLDKKRVEIAGLLSQVNEEKEKFEKLKVSNEERLKNENLIAQDFIQRELEALRIKKSVFEASMERERLLLSEKAQSDRNHMLLEFELKKRELELDMQNKLKKAENNFLEKEKAMEQREMEMNSINYSREVAKKLEEKSKDIDRFNNLVKKLEDQYNGLKEFIEKHEKCKDCGAHVSDFARSYPQLFLEIGNTEISPLPRLSKGFTSRSINGSALDSVKLAETSLSTGADSGAPGGHASSLLGCTTILKRSEDPDAQCQVEELPLSNVQLSIGSPKGSREFVAVPSTRIESSVIIRKLEDQPNPSVKEQSTMDFKRLEIPKVPLHAGLESVHHKHGINPRRGCRRASSVKAAAQDVKVVHTEPNSVQPKRAINPRRGVRRESSVKGVIEDTKNVAAKTPEPMEGKKPSGITNVDAGISGGGGQGDSACLDQEPVAVEGKCLRGPVSGTTTVEQDIDSSASIAAKGSRKRRQTVIPGPQVPEENRYNLRRRK